VTDAIDLAEVSVGAPRRGRHSIPPNVHLSIYEIQLVLRELEGYEMGIVGKPTGPKRRFARKLIAKLYEIDGHDVTSYEEQRPNVFLSVRDMFLIVGQLGSYEKHIKNAPATQQRTRALIDKLRAIRWWSP
jgi:hypothetical protein